MGEIGPVVAELRRFKVRTSFCVCSGCLLTHVLLPCSAAILLSLPCCLFARTQTTRTPTRIPGIRQRTGSITLVLSGMQQMRRAPGGGSGGWQMSTPGESKAARTPTFASSQWRMASFFWNDCRVVVPGCDVQIGHMKHHNRPNPSQRT